MDMTLLSAGIDASSATQGAAQWNAAVDSMADRAEEAMSKIRGSLSGVGSSLGSLKTIIAGVTFGEMVKDIMNASMQFDRIRNILTATSGSAAMASVQFDMLTRMAYKYGQSLPVIAQQYAMMTAAARGTSLAGEKVDKIFKAIIITGTALGLSQDQTQRTMQAVDHMMSKQIVTAQDLRRQFGNNIPAAMVMSAKAMGVTVIEFNKMLKSGTVMAKDLLPKLADEMIKTYQDAADKASGQTRALVERIKTAWFQLEVWIAHSGLGETFNNSLKQISDLLQSDQLKQAATEFGKVLAEGVTIAGKALLFLLGHARGVLHILEMFVALKTAVFFLNLATNVNKAKNALLEFEVVQRVIGGLQLIPGRVTGGAQEATSDFAHLLQNKKGGLLSQSQLNTRLSGSAAEGMSAYEKIQLSRLAAQQGLSIPITASDQYASLATAPLRAGTRAIGGIRAGIGGLGAALTGNTLVSAITTGFKEAGKIETVESGYKGKQLPKSLEYALGKNGKFDVETAVKNAPWTKQGFDIPKVKADMEALNFVLDKNGNILNNGAIKTRLAGSAYKALSEEAKGALEGITVSLGATEAPAVSMGARILGMLGGVRTVALGAWAAISTGFVEMLAGMGVALAANPITLPVVAILASIAAISAALYALRNHTLEIGGHTATVGNYIGVVWDSVAEKFKEVWEAVTNWFKTTWTAVSGWFKGIWSGMSTWFDGLSQSAGWKRIEAFMSKFNILKDWAEKAEQRENNKAQGVGDLNSSNFGKLVGDANLTTLANPGYDAARKMMEGFTPQTPGPFSDDGAVTKPSKGDPFKETVAMQETLISKYQDILALDTATKSNQIEINALYAAREKIIELEKGGKTALTGNEKSQLEALYAQSYTLDDQAKAKTSADEIGLRATTDIGGNEKQLAYLSTVTASTKNYKAALAELNAVTKAYDETRDLEGRITDDQLERLRWQLELDAKSKQSYEDKKGAMTEYLATMININSVAADQAKILADLNQAGIEGAGKKSYEPFNRNSQRLSDEAYRYADETLGKSHQKDNLTPDLYNQAREGLANQYKDTDQIKYVQDLITFSQTVKKASGDLDDLVKQKKKLDDAFSKNYINQNDYNNAISDLQKSWDKAVDEQLLRSDKWQDGVILGMRSISREAGDTAKQIEGAFTSVFKGLEDKMITLLDTGKITFRDFLSGVRHQVDTMLVKSASGKLTDYLLGGAGNTQGNPGGGKTGVIGQDGPMGPIAKWLGISRSANGGLNTAGVKSPTGMASDPIYVALTTGSSSDFTGIPQKLGGGAPNEDASGSASAIKAANLSNSAFSLAASSGSPSSVVNATSSISSWLNNPVVSTLSNATKQYGYAGLASQGGAQHIAGHPMSGISNVFNAFAKGFLGSLLPGLGAGFGGAGITPTDPGFAGLSDITDFSSAMGASDPVTSFMTDLLPDAGFANGGIMTSKGVMTYSKGGIANRPQLAQFGEGRTPEAYVPLPDGRTIPVNINGNGASGDTTVQHVTNIYDQTGRGVQTTQTNRMDGKTYVQEIFLQDMQQEGPMSAGMRSYFGQR